MLASIVAAFVSVAQAQEFVPALQHGSRSVAQWIEELQHGAQPLDAVWSLYYADERSAAVIAALKDALAPSRTPECRMAADTILCQWHVQHELLPAEVYSGGATIGDYAKRFEPPEELAQGERGKLLQHLVHNEDAAQALQHLLDVPLATEWAAAFAGSSWFDALGERLAQSESLEKALASHADWENQIAKHGAGATAAIPWLARILARGGAEAEFAHRLIGPLTGWQCRSPDQPPDPYYLLNRAIPRTEEFVDPLVEQHLLDEAARALEAKPLSPETTLWLHAVALANPRVAELCRQRLPDRLGAAVEPASDILRLLTHVESNDPRVHAAYVRTLRDWNESDSAGLEAVPFWRKHDDETRTALRELILRATKPAALDVQLCFAGEVDAASSELARIYLERTRGTSPWLVSEGFRGKIEVDKQLSLAQQVNQIALNIAGKQAHGEEFADDEQQLVAILERPYDKGGAGGYDDQVQWGFFHAQQLGLHSRALVRVALHYIKIGDTLEGYSTHSDAAGPYLESIPLEIEDHLALRKLRPPDRAEPQWRGIDLAESRFGGEPVTKLSLEDVPRWRRKLFSGEPHFLANLLRVTPLTEREEPYLVTLLERGSVEQRVWALGVVEEHHLDSPGVRTSIQRLAEHDLDAGVRRSAARIARNASGPR